MIHYSVLWHVYDQFRRAMGKSLDEAGNFERIFKRVGVEEICTISGFL